MKGLLLVLAAAQDIEVLTVSGEMRHVDMSSIVTQPGALNATTNAVTQFFKDMVCGNGNVTDPADVSFPAPSPSPEASAPAPAPAQEVPEGVPTVPIAFLGRRNSTNGTNGTNESAAAAADPGPCGAPVVQFYLGAGSNFGVEMDYSEDAEKVFKDADFPRHFSNWLLTLPQVIMYAEEPPIVPSVLVEKKTVTPMVADCAAHVPKILESFRHSYTNRMTPWALDAACGYFMTGMSFTTDHTPNDDDRVFCETASKHLMRTHFAGEKDYESWCHDVCEHRHGPVRVCKMPEAPAEEAAPAAAEGNASFVEQRHVMQHRHVRLRRAKVAGPRGR